MPKPGEKSFRVTARDATGKGGGRGSLKPGTAGRGSVKSSGAGTKAGRSSIKSHGAGTKAGRSSLKPHGAAPKTERLSKKSPATKPISGRKPSMKGKRASVATPTATPVTKGTPASSAPTAFSGRKSVASGKKQSMQSGRSSIASTRIPTVRRGPSPGGGRKGAPTVVMVPAAGEEGEEGVRRFLPLALLVGLVLLILAVLIIVIVLGVVLSGGSSETNVSIISGTGDGNGDPKPTGDTHSVNGSMTADPTGKTAFVVGGLTTEELTTVTTTTTTTEATTTTTTTTTTEASTTTSLCHGNADLVVILDASGSIFDPAQTGNPDGRTFKKEQDIMKRVTDGLPIEDQKVRVAVIIYATTAFLQHKLTDQQNKAAVAYAIESLPCHMNTPAGGYCKGATITIDALKMAWNQFKLSTRPNAKKVIMIVTDGHHNDGKQRDQSYLRPHYINLIAQLSNEGIEVYASTVSSKLQVDEDNMLIYTSNRADRYFIGDEALKVRKLIVDAVEAKPC